MTADSGAHMDFPLLKLVNTSRSTYGLRHQDFGRYKSHCTNKVQHLRKSLKLTQTGNKSKKFTKKDITENNASTERHLQILLFEAERAWAHAQFIKAAESLPATSPKAKHHSHKRLSKAAYHSHRLFNILTSEPIATRISDFQKTEAACYYVTLKGTLLFEQEKHEDCLSALSVAHTLLSLLASRAETAHMEALADEVIDEIEPMLRFCAYTLQIDTSKKDGLREVAKKITDTDHGKWITDYEKLVNGLNSGTSAASKEPIQLSWRAKEIPVRNAELVDIVIKVKKAILSLEADKDLGSGGKKNNTREQRTSKGRKEILGARRMGTYDKALLVLSDAEVVAKQLLDDNKIALSRLHSARSEASSSPLQLAHSYILYQLLSVRCKRDLLLILDTQSKLALRESKIRSVEREYASRMTGVVDPQKAASKIRKQRAKVYPSLIKIYDGILLSLEQLRDLEEVERDGELATQIEAETALVKASRCMVLARSYSLVDQFKAGLGINSRAKIYARQARSAAMSLDSEVQAGVSSDEPDFIRDILQLTDSSFNDLDRELEQDYVRMSKEWYNVTGGRIAGDDAGDLPMEDLTVASDPIQRKKKSAFYDVAFNYIAAFDMDSIARKAGLRESGAESESGSPEDGGKDNYDSDASMEEESKQSEATSKSGWGFGLFGRK